jgi:hypothetical protein
MESFHHRDTPSSQQASFFFQLFFKDGQTGLLKSRFLIETYRRLIGLMDDKE